MSSAASRRSRIGWAIGPVAGRDAGAELLEVLAIGVGAMVGFGASAEQAARAAAVLVAADRADVLAGRTAAAACDVFVDGGGQLPGDSDTVAADRAI